MFKKSRQLLEENGEYWSPEENKNPFRKYFGKPFEGIRKPEPLKYSLAGAWSRRIDFEHRLVYKVTDSEIVVLSARGHYEK